MEYSNRSLIHAISSTIPKEIYGTLIFIIAWGPGSLNPALIGSRFL
jgi:hypothetical protein